MNAVVSTVKCCVLLFNLVCLLLGIGTITVSSLGLEEAAPNTPEHSYFIVAIILGCLVCMTTILGFYGVACELLGVNVVYALFIFLLLIVQYLQMHTYELNFEWTPVIYSRQSTAQNGAFVQVPTAASTHNDLDKFPYLNEKTGQFYLFGLQSLFNSSAKNQFEMEKICNALLMISEGIAFIYATMLSVLLFRRNRGRHLRPVRSLEYLPGLARAPAPLNHINSGSRANLLSNEVI